VRDQREQPLGGGVLPAARDTKLAEQAREISRRQQRTERAAALVERQKQVAALLGTALTGEPSRWRRSPWVQPTQCLGPLARSIERPALPLAHEGPFA
jgi:hypothetical protein